MDYVALDVDPTELRASLARLVKCDHYEHVRCSGLLGTYEDLVGWLDNGDCSHQSNSVFLWLGSSCCNLKPDSMLKLMHTLTRQHRRMIIGVDGCDNAQTLSAAYATPCGLSAKFILNGLSNVNSMLGSPQFNVQDWEFSPRYNRPERTFQSYVRAKKASEAIISGHRMCFAEEDEVLMIESRKMNLPELAALCAPFDVRIMTSWVDLQSEYGECLPVL